ncbi:2,3-bisphosphoglycerate-dependent phosphoglycerate mutase [Corynebacterium ciconiae DSM 44920]|uniref:histidine phosphatase family protein n=1 Tax=Corynebacterium ciconiae TaxID=227319 RepID=UPI00037074D0|nr:histidine phosphatase family protein [Corynebacterium ciconiae]WKD60225.1 2,3-bisphosphoglycerate-dependent phosphoglycerate mutase [Corynebacterium ciconiae DSM 44920]
MSTSPRTGRIILARHGQTYANKNLVLDTLPPGAELTELGQSQAQELGQKLAEFSGPHLGRIYSGVAIRAQQTAMRAAASFREDSGLPLDRVLVREGVHEISAGDLEGSTRREDAELYVEHFVRRLRGEQAALPGGESLRAIVSRYLPVLVEMLNDHVDAGRDAVLVNHGAISRTVATHACALEPEFARDHRLENCGLIVLEPRGRIFGRWTLTHWSDTPVEQLCGD